MPVGGDGRSEGEVAEVLQRVVELVEGRVALGPSAVPLGEEVGVTTASGASCNSSRVSSERSGSKGKTPGGISSVGKPIVRQR